MRSRGRRSSASRLPTRLESNVGLTGISSNASNSMKSNIPVDDRANKKAPAVCRCGGLVTFQILMKMEMGE